MPFDFVQDASLPAGAWCLQSRARSTTVEVHHGAGVETLDTGFALGAWTGAFDAAGLAGARERMGAGAVLRDDQLVLLPATHPYEHMAVARRGDRLFASNSLVFLLVAIGARPKLN